MSRLGRRAAWHVGLALRAARVGMALAAAAGAAMPFLLPVTEAWLVGVVAITAALVAFTLVAVAGRDPPPIQDVEAALERGGTADLAAHALARAALILGSLAVGLAIGGWLAAP